MHQGVVSRAKWREIEAERERQRERERMRERQRDREGEEDDRFIGHQLPTTAGAERQARKETEKDRYMYM